MYLNEEDGESRLWRRKKDDVEEEQEGEIKDRREKGVDVGFLHKVRINVDLPAATATAIVHSKSSDFLLSLPFMSINFRGLIHRNSRKFE